MLLEGCLPSPPCHENVQRSPGSGMQQGHRACVLLTQGRCLGTEGSQSLSRTFMSHSPVANIMATNIWLKLTKDMRG